MRRCFSIVALLTLVLYSACNTPQKHAPLNVSGWNEATWGMSEDQLTKIFPNSKRVKEPQRHLPHAIEALIIDDYIEDGLHYSVTFYIDSSTRGLVRVIQTYYGPSAVDAYDQLRDGLKEKYGPTSEPETDASYLKVMEWNSPTTRIELLYGSEGLVGREYTFLSYKLADQMNEAK